jgi:hypothetical protein
MATKKEEGTIGKVVLEPEDVGILYSLAQQATIKVSDVTLVSSVLEKCKLIISTIKK